MREKEVEKGRLRPIGPWFSFMTSHLVPRFNGCGLCFGELYLEESVV